MLRVNFKIYDLFVSNLVKAFPVAMSIISRVLFDFKIPTVAFSPFALADIVISFNDIVPPTFGFAKLTLIVSIK